MCNLIIKSSGVLVATAILMTSANARGQCNTWLAGPLTDQSDGFDGFGIASTSVVWTPLTGGPPLLVVGGSFATAGGVTCHSIAAWDGAAWRDLGGTSFPGSSSGEVLALAVYNGDLIAAGHFEGAGGVAAHNIARFDGTAWHAMGTGLDGAIPQSFPYCRSLAVLNGELIAGGHFQFANGLFSPNIAKWNGSTWIAMPGGGIGDSISSVDTVYALRVHSNGVLYVGGFFHTVGLPGSMITANNIAQFNPSTQVWSGLTSGTGGGTPGVYAINSFGADVIIGGGFTTAGGASVNHVARWITAGGPAGNWALMSTGVGGNQDSVWALQPFNGQMMAGGIFPGTVTAWNGSTWTTVSGGLAGGVGNQPRAFTLNMFNSLQYGSVLMAAGTFGLAGGSVPVNGIAQWDPVGVTWRRLDPPPPVIQALATLGVGPSSRLVMGGDFAQSTSSLPVANVIAWNGQSLQPLGTGMNAPVFALKSFDTSATTSELIAGGAFTTAGSAGANRIARHLEPVALSSWVAMGTGFNNTVLALDRAPANQVLSDSVYAGGAFTASGTGATTFNRIAEWSGSPPAWTSLGTGLNNTVRAIKAFNTGTVTRQVIAGGDFTMAGTTSVSHIAVWPIFNLNGWQAMGAGFNNTVYAIERLNSVIYAAGAFTASGATTLNRIAQWNGSAWTAVGNGGAAGGFNGVVRALRVVGTSLYAAGEFTSVDGIPANRIAKWDGTAWSAVPGGAEDTVLSIVPYQSELIVGGLFTGVGNPTLFALGIGRYSETGVPWITQQPLSDNLDCTANATFTVAVAPGYPGVTFAWRKNGTPLANGATVSGSLVSGATTPTLSIAGIGNADAANYDCVVTDTCGSVTSAGATLTLAAACCPADINHSGAIDVDDLLAVISSWGPCPAPPVACPPDIAPAGGNGVVNVDDMLAVIAGWGSCAP